MSIKDCDIHNSIKKFVFQIYFLHSATKIYIGEIHVFWSFPSCGASRFFPCYIKLDNFLIEKVGQTELISIEPNKEQFMTRPHAC